MRQITTTGNDYYWNLIRGFARKKMGMQEEENIREEVYRDRQYQDDHETIRMRLDATPMLDQLHYTLLGFELVHDQEKGYSYWKDEGDPWLSKQGARKLIGLLRSLLSVDKALSNIQNNEYNDILRSVGENMMEFIMLNKSAYGIKDSMRSMIYTTVLNNVKIFLTQARGGWHNELVSAGFQHRETRVRNDKSQSIEDQPKKLSLIPRR